MIEDFVKALMSVGNLVKNQAKVLLYYAVATWADQLKIRAIINIHGESGTGKNGIMRQLFKWCRNAFWINARNKTQAQFRDELADKTTVFIEEADKTKEPRECEMWIQNRYDDSGKGVTHKKSRGMGYFSAETHDYCGYTVLHTQNTFQGIELDRRTITVNIPKDSHRLYKLVEGLDSEELKKIALEVDWESPIEQTSSNSAWDCWLPLIKVAKHIGDEEFITYAKEQIDQKSESDDDTQIFEPKGVVLSEIMPLYKSDSGSHIPITLIRDKVRPRGYELTERQITKIVRDLGFTIVKPQNKAHIKIEGTAKLKEITTKFGLNAEECFETVDLAVRSQRKSFSEN